MRGPTGGWIEFVGKSDDPRFKACSFATAGCCCFLKVSAPLAPGDSFAAPLIWRSNLEAQVLSSDGVDNPGRVTFISGR